MKLKNICLWLTLISLLGGLTSCSQSAPTSEIPSTQPPVSTAAPSETEAPTEPLMTHTEYLNYIRKAIAPAQGLIGAGRWHGAAVRSDGTVLYAGENQGTREQAADFTNMQSIDCKGFYYITGITRDGNAVITPHAPYNFNVGQHKLKGWTDMVQLTGNGLLTVGLQKDGTLRAAGGRSIRWDGEKPIESLKGARKVWATDIDTLAALTPEGTVEFWPQENLKDNDQNEGYIRSTRGWDGLVDLAAEEDMILGIREDGSVLTGGILHDWEKGYYQDVPPLDWTDIVAADVFGWWALGLRADGTVVFMDNRAKLGGYPQDPELSKVSLWEDIVAISLGSFAMGLKADGTILACGYPTELAEEISHWKLDPIEIDRNLPHQES